MLVSEKILKKLANGSDVRGVAVEGVPDEPVTLSVDVNDPAGGELAVRVGDTWLRIGTDYVITGYRNNTKKGTARVTLQGIGQYSGTKTAGFRIRAKSFLSALFVSAPDA